MFRTVGIALLALGLPAMSSVAQATATGTLCPAQQVATLPGMARVDIDGVAPGGRFQVGAATRADGTGATVLWDNGVPQLVATGHENSWGVDVDDGGQAVLVTSDGDATARWRYRNGALEELPTPAGYFNPTVKAIDNDRGDILGTVSDADGWNVRAVVWNSANQPRVLPVPAGYNEVQVGDIDDGTVVGTVLDFDIPNARTRAMKPAYWFTDGRAATIPASAPEAFAQADAIRNGIVAGVDAGQVTTWQVGANASGTAIVRGAPVTAVNLRGTIAYQVGSEPWIHQPGIGERQLELQDTGGASGASVAGLTDDDQLYGVDGSTGAPVHWNCS